MSILADHASPSRCTSFIIVSMLLVIIGLTSYIVYKEVKDTEVKTLKHVTKENDVLRIYGDFFKTPEEQQEIERKYFSNPNNTESAPTERKVSPRYYQFGVCNMNGSQLDFYGKPSRRRRASNPGKGRQERGAIEYSYHGCCTSYRKFISPPTAIGDINGAEVELVHYQNNRQHFLADICWHDMNCGVQCGCRKQIGLFRALIHNPRFNSGQNWNPNSTPNSNSNHDADNDEPPFKVMTVRLGGSCKCMNDVTPGMFGR